MLRTLRSRKGFTLIELMIVVAIIGILAAVAIPNFLSMRLKAKTSEAKANLGAIRTCEEAYQVEEDTYLTCAKNPTSDATKLKRDWATGNTDFKAIGFVPTGKVYYSYQVDANANILTDFVATATGNLDGEGDNDSIFTLSSSSGDIVNTTPTTF